VQVQGTREVFFQEKRGTESFGEGAALNLHSFLTAGAYDMVRTEFYAVPNFGRRKRKRKKTDLRAMTEFAQGH